MNATVEPEQDYRYTMGDLEFEGYQITPLTRFQDQLWPDWLSMQRLADETNALYRSSEEINVLILALPTGDVELPDLAWVARYKDGHFGLIDALDMEQAVKVVPIPPPVVMPSADGIPDAAGQLAAVPNRTAENVAGDITEMRAEMMSAIKLLKEGSEEKAVEALDYLILCVSKRTRWCNCPPGQCSQEDDAGCRLHSPLVI